MSSEIRIPELLAPAGSEASLHAAVSAGADAVYLGLDSFNARRNADNFSIDTFSEVVEYAHLRGVKVYVTMNTIILPNELDDAFSMAVRLSDAKADGVIVQDIGLASLISRYIPKLPLHISTQMNTHSSFGVEAAYTLGAKRVTLARELSIYEIENLSQVADGFGIEVETFAHGALCVCYSGQCFMSSLIGGRSANRGLCAQACRLPYELRSATDPDRTLNAPGEFLLSPKDLCSIDHIRDLAEAGVSSLKIEGRMKSPEYVYTVVSTYRKVLNRLKDALDTLSDESNSEEPEKSEGLVRGSFSDVPEALSESEQLVKASDREALSSVFSRGFSPAYLESERGNSIMSFQRPNNRGQFAGRVKAIEDGIIHMSKEIDMKAGDILEFWTGKGNVTLRVPSLFEEGRKTVYLPIDTLGSQAAGIRVGDRVFRVRSSAAEFADDPHEPRVPVDCRATLKIGEALKIEFSLNLDASLGKSERSMRSVFDRFDAAEIKGEAQGDIVEAARSKAVTEEDVRAHIDRMGQTPFRLVNFEVELDEGVGIGFSKLHHCRADALLCLEKSILSAYTAGERETEDGFGNDAANESGSDTGNDAANACGFADRKASSNGGSSKLSRLSKGRLFGEPEHTAASAQSSKSEIVTAVLATNPDTARAAKRVGIDLIYVPALNYRRGQSETAGCLDRDVRQAGFPKGCIPVMPVIDHDILPDVCEKESTCFDAYDIKAANRESAIAFDVWDYASEDKPLVAESLGAIQHAIDLGAVFEVGAHLPITNRASVEIAELLGAKRIWLSPELNLAQISALSKKSRLPMGIKVQGHQEVMTTEHCMLMSQGNCAENCPDCTRRKVAHFLKDRKGYDFPVITDMFGRSHIYNGIEQDVVPSVPELIKAGVSAFMIDATLMDAEETAHAAGRLIKAVKLAGSGDTIDKKSKTTAGHLFRGVS